MNEGETHPRTNVVIMGTVFIGWSGGIDLIRNILNALSMENKNFPINLYLILPDNSLLAVTRRIASFAKYTIKSLMNIEKPNFTFNLLIDHRSILRSLNNINGEFRTIYYNGNKSSLKHALRKVKASVLMLSANTLGQNFPFPWVGYIADFQHKYYPEFFSQSEINSRNILFERMVNCSSTVIVNSKAVKGDIEKYYPKHRANLIELPFTPLPIRSWFEPPTEDIFKKYELPKRYFMISNQFWVHKDHKTAFQALSLLHDEYGKKNIKIVCTGKMEDSRFPEYVSELFSQVSSLGLEKSIIFLGYIPKIDQVQIMKGCIAVIQPTLFEGGPGGGAIYDSVALGIPSIVSNIKVNMEADDKSVHYFHVGDAHDLAEKMVDVASQEYSFPNEDVQFFVSRVRMEEYSRRLIDSIKHALE